MARLAPEVASCRAAVAAALADVPAGELVLAAVSGGADSVALAAALAFVAPRAGLRAGAVTVDHGLQPGSAERAAAVVELTRGLGLDPAVAVRAAVGVSGGPEAAARQARYAALDVVIDDVGASVLLLGHTLDDQAETVLLGLARGSGLRSVAGMPAVRGRYRRPLLGVRRAATRAACAAAGLAVWDDPHNADPAYARARVRTHALPVLERTLGPGVAEALARTAALAAADAAALDGWAAAARTAEVAELAALPAAVRGRVLRALLVDAGVPAGSLSAAHVAAVGALVGDWRGQRGVDLPGGYRARRECGRLTVDEPPTAARG